MNKLSDKIMTREEFKEKWNSDERGSEITYYDVARHYVEWGIGTNPFCSPLNDILLRVLKEAGVEDLPEEEELENECCY